MPARHRAKTLRREKSSPSVREMFSLAGRVAAITGGAGMLGRQHAEAIAEMGGVPVLLDIDRDRVKTVAGTLASEFGIKAVGLCVDITQPEAVADALSEILRELGRVDILINNAANNPKVEADGRSSSAWSRLEGFPLAVWQQDLAVGLTGAFLCSRIIGAELARQRRGVILNIASDLAVIAPDQRIYSQPGLPEERRPVKPVSYSVVKAGLLGLTRYLATYWAERGVRVNALCPGGVDAGQGEEFKERLHFRIPMGRMARKDEYKSAVVFLVSDASSYMTGSVVVIDGGRTCW